MVQSLKNIALGTLVSLVAVAYGNKTWHPNPAKDMGSSVSYGNAALTDMSWWLDESNNPGSGAPTAQLRLCFHGGVAHECGRHDDTAPGFEVLWHENLPPLKTGRKDTRNDD